MAIADVGLAEFRAHFSAIIPQGLQGPFGTAKHSFLLDLSPRSYPLFLSIFSPCFWPLPLILLRWYLLFSSNFMLETQALGARFSSLFTLTSLEIPSSFMSLNPFMPLLTTCKHICRPHLSSGLIQTTSSPSRQEDLTSLLFSSGLRLNFVSFPQIYSLHVQVNRNSNFPVPSAKTSVPSLSSFPYHHNYSVKKSFCITFKVYPEVDLFGSPLGWLSDGSCGPPWPGRMQWTDLSLGLGSTILRSLP